MQNDIRPRVSIIVAAYNEEDAIAKKLNDLLRQDYPAEDLEIIVASDGSTDRTDDIVRGFAGQGVRLIQVKGRLGKTASQNAAVTQATGDILVFTDATTEIDTKATKNILRNFADPSVGCVGGRLTYVSVKRSAVGQGGESYWHYERNLKRMESTVNSLIGVSGCLYAVRRDIYKEIPPHLISDFVIALDTYESGYRVAYAEDAQSYEETLEDPKREFTMRARVVIRSISALCERRYLLNPFRHGLFAIQLLSHKVLRYLIPVFVIGVFVSNALLLDGPIFRILFLLQTLFYLSAVFGHILQTFHIKTRIGSQPYYFVIANLAALMGLIRYLRGERIVTWNPIR